MASSFISQIYDFATMALIKIFAFPNATVCELYCSGDDTCKWDDVRIGHYIGINGLGAGLSEAREIWESQNKPYSAEFCEADPCTDELEGFLQDKGIPVDIICCFHHLQLCSESMEKTRRLLQNVSSLLKPGGYFFGIVPDSPTIWNKYQKSVEASLHKGGGPKSNVIPNCIYSKNYIITFEVEEEKFPFFGKKYQMKFANETTFESHYLVHFGSLIRLAREAGLDYMKIQNLTEFYDEHRAQYAGILSRHGPNFVDRHGNLLPHSFDVLGLYSLFSFKKSDPDAAPPLVMAFLKPNQDPSHDQQVRTGESASNANTEEGERGKGILGPGPSNARSP